MLVWTEDKVGDSHPLYPLNYKKGDVITVHADGWHWTERKRHLRLLRAHGEQNMMEHEDRKEDKV